MNELTEMLGAELLALELLDVAAELLVAAALELDDDDDELPQAVTPTHAHEMSAAMTGLLFSKFTVTSSSSGVRQRCGATQRCGTPQGCRSE